MENVHPLTESCCKNEANETAHGLCQVSQQENTSEIAGLPFNTESKCKLNIDTLIISLQKKAVDDALSPKSPHIASLFKIVSSFLYENSASENAFSINKYMIQLHGTAVDSDIIDALRFVKGTILNYEVMLNVPITNRGVALDI